MRIVAPALALALVVAALAPRPARACSIMEPEDRFFQDTAPAGGVFVVHLADEDPLAPLPDDAVLRDTMTDEIFPVEVVSRAGPALAIRVPFGVPPGGLLLLDGVELEWQWGDRSTHPLTVSDGPPPVVDDAPSLGAPPVELVEERYDEATLVPLPDPNAMYGCGGPGAGLKAKAIRHRAILAVNDVVVRDGPMVLDLWVSDDEDTILSSLAPTYAGYTLAKDAFSSVVTSDGGSTIEVALPVAPGATKLVHAQLRDPKTGLASAIEVLEVSVPDDEDDGVGCASVRVDDDGVPGGTLAVVAGMALVVGRRRRR